MLMLQLCGPGRIKIRNVFIRRSFQLICWWWDSIFLSAGSVQKIIFSAGCRPISTDCINDSAGRFADLIKFSETGLWNRYTNRLNLTSAYNYLFMGELRVELY